MKETERDLLIILCQFISSKQIVVGDEKSIKSMVAVYANPPFTMAYPVAIRLTMADTYKLNELLQKAHDLLEATEPVT